MIGLLLALVLFDGQTLAGWLVEGDADWQVDNDAITASGDGQGFLVSQGEFADFRLTLQFRVDATVNSGVFIRCRDRARIHPDSCYELNIWDDHPRQEARTGSIVLEVMPPLERVETVGRWSTLTVEARGPLITLWINGIKTASLADAKTGPGFIALQHWEHGTVKFRNIELTLLED